MKVGWIVLGKSQDEPYVDQWGLMKTEQDLQEEYDNIEEEIDDLQRGTDFQFFGGDIARTVPETLDLSRKYRRADVLVVFAVSGAGTRKLLNALTTYGLPLIFFNKIEKDRMYGHALYQQWYQMDAVREFTDVDLVINDYGKLLAKLRAYRAVKKLEESKVLCVGEPNDFFAGGLAARAAVDKFRPAIDYMSFETFKKRLEEKSLEDEEVIEVKDRFLDNASTVSGEIDEETSLRSARVYVVLKELIEENEYDAITINCLSGILDLVGTTPCIAFQRLRDEGVPAVCEADIPQLVTTILLRHIAEKPTFINDPVIIPDENKVVVAHCTAPTKMGGYDEEAEDYDASLHHETKLGLAPSVKFSEGREITLAGVSHDFDEMVATKGVITRNTSYHICISQAEIEVEDSQFLLDNFKGFHWVMVYDEWIEELEKACDLLSIQLITPEP
ncbi:hypothetical protein AKJ37_02910 [candidate division MSBL1 archaeon SCGC-AAA259I09]|uniref:L-fucose isomerase C-terminal domain-containing protein n=2 Tax=candidate division MSBL1 TaxID=215777 RepID=A0A133UT97_9EURY|nr:hypothetical protein AKJ66_03910 [candidate division MSBL1 archaeon SCGC-AAA259E22]KXA97464.1 hypothetical protein AKJ37_02910 [candidate division MSBL1 archaeon SCGC-AAA259I09]